MADKQENEQIEWMLIAETQPDGNGGWYAIEQNTSTKELRQLHYERHNGGQVRVSVVDEPFGLSNNSWVIR